MKMTIQLIVYESCAISDKQQTAECGVDLGCILSLHQVETFRVSSVSKHLTLIKTMN